MSKMAVIYWSGTGNTEAMAEAIADGGRLGGVEVEVVFVDSAKKQQVENADLVALGCPSMGAEVLEEDSMEPFVESLSSVNWAGKKLALFGSYDWGDCEWMRNWEEQMKGFGADLIQEGLTINLEPDADDLDLCKALGKKLAE